MMRRGLVLGVLIAGLMLPGGPARAGGLLDGRQFTGMIGPVEDPDLPDSLYFENGHFWSEICTRCGFHPGPYAARATDEGIAFEGVLQSDTRGRFEYSGLVRDDGVIEVSIQWERRRWYWTARREIGFVGAARAAESPVSLSLISQRMSTIDPDANPQCAGF